MQRAWWSGTAAALLSAAALAVCGKLEGVTATGPLNGPSQWVWGRPAARRRRASVRHTLVGYVIHHLASLGWAVLHEKYVASRVTSSNALPHVVAGSATAAFACLADYQIARGRLQPGFEKQLSRGSLAVVYAAFGVGLAVQCCLRARSHRSRRPQSPGG